MSDTSRKILGSHIGEPEDFVLVPADEVWFKFDGIVFVGKWDYEDGKLGVSDIKQTPYKEVPFVKVNLVRY